MGHIAYCSLFNAVNSMFLIFYNLLIINNILLLYNTFFRKDLNGKQFFSCENALHYIFLQICLSIFLVYCTETNLLVIKSPTFDSYNINKDIRIYILI